MNHRPKIYVSSRASIIERVAMWQQYKTMGANIISTWIDRASTNTNAINYPDLWHSIQEEILSCDRFVFYAEPGDFPMKGAMVEVGIAMAYVKPIWILGNNLELEGETFRPLGSWVKHHSITVFKPRATLNDMMQALGLHS
jgi:hypothetical protein